MSRHITLQQIGGNAQVLACSGDWTAHSARALEAELRGITPGGAIAPAARAITLDIAGIERLDTVGAWLLIRLQRGFGGQAQFSGGTAQHRQLLTRIDQSEHPDAAPPVKGLGVLAPLILLGRMVVGAGRDLVAANAVQGHILVALLRTLGLRAPLRFASFVNQFEQIVLRAIPIVALISLVVGAIITQQTILQLQVFGMAIFVVDLAAILMFREIGVLLAAIMVAGRSGSAITAEIGAMRLREEFDALEVMGVDPYQALMLPRVVALVTGLPLLAFIGSMAGLAGAALVARFYGDIPLDIFISRLQGAMSPTSVIVGLIKAPFMAFLIGLLASIEGMKVEGSSESLGRHTTSSVVKAIFFVIVADGLFAVFFAALGF